MIPIFKPAPYKPKIVYEGPIGHVTYDLNNNPVFIINKTTGQWRKNLYNKDELIYSEFWTGDKYKFENGTPIQTKTI